jgi:hypothetical protein
VGGDDSRGLKRYGENDFNRYRKKLLAQRPIKRTGSEPELELTNPFRRISVCWLPKSCIQGGAGFEVEPVKLVRDSGSSLKINHEESIPLKSS